MMKFAIRVLIKATVLFVSLNVLFMVIDPMPLVNRLTLYGTLYPYRERLPYGEVPSESYSVTLTNIDALLASHEIQRPKTDNEWRVVFLGDSGVWGWLLEPQQTLTSCINQANLATPQGQKIRAYNLGYPVLDATKDLLLLDAIQDYDPDMVVWMVTLAALYPDEQLFHGVVQANPETVSRLIQQYDLNLDPSELPNPPTGLEQTIIGQRDTLARWWRHQVYGVAWALTGVDHRNPNFFAPVRQNLRGGSSMLNGQEETAWTQQDLSFDVLQAGAQITAEAGIELLFINEPIYRSAGLNSELRYNFYYPRWAYDQYRDLMTMLVTQEQWNYLDLWDIMPPSDFTDSSLHLNANATCQLANQIGAELAHYSAD